MELAKSQAIEFSCETFQVYLSLNSLRQNFIICSANEETSLRNTVISFHFPNGLKCNLGKIDRNVNLLVSLKWFYLRFAFLEALKANKLQFDELSILSIYRSKLIQSFSTSQIDSKRCGFRFAFDPKYINRSRYRVSFIDIWKKSSIVRRQRSVDPSKLNLFPNKRDPTHELSPPRSFQKKNQFRKVLI